VRTTGDLIKELLDEAPKFYVLMLVLRFKGSNIRIDAHDPDALSKLDAAVEAGGEPIGVLAVDSRKGKLRLRGRLLQEHTGDEYLEEFMTHLIRAIVQEVKATPTTWIQ
jgi:hypothetical protein